MKLTSTQPPINELRWKPRLQLTSAAALRDQFCEKWKLQEREFYTLEALLHSGSITEQSQPLTQRQLGYWPLATNLLMASTIGLFVGAPATLAAMNLSGSPLVGLAVYGAVMAGTFSQLGPSGVYQSERRGSVKLEEGIPTWTTPGVHPVRLNKMEAVPNSPRASKLAAAVTAAVACLPGCLVAGAGLHGNLVGLVTLGIPALAATAAIAGESYLVSQASCAQLTPFNTATPKIGESQLESSPVLQDSVS